MTLYDTVDWGQVLNMVDCGQVLNIEYKNGTLLVMTINPTQTGTTSTFKT